MTQGTTRERAASLLRFLEQRADQLERFHSGNYKLIIQGFCDFFDRDDVVGEVAKALGRRAPTSAKAWFERAQQAGQVPPLPEAPDACFALRYALLKHVRMEKVDLRWFVTNFFPGAFLDEKLMHFKRLVVHPFGADCRTLARLVTPRLRGEWVDLPAVLDEVLDSDAFRAEAFGPRAWSDEDDRKAEEAEKATRGKLPGERAAAAAPPAIPPPAAAPARAADAPPRAAAPAPTAVAPALAAALDALDAALAGAGLEGPPADDLRLDVLALRVEATRAIRRGARLAARLDDLASHPGLADAVAAVRAAL